MDKEVIERRLVRTYFSKKPTGPAFIISISTLFLCGVVSRIYWSNLEISSYLAANGEKVFHQGELWRLFTSTLVHGDMGHLLSNFYMLGILGFFVYAYFGWTLYPIATFFLAGLVNAYTLSSYPTEVYLIGASGWVYLLAGFWLTMFVFIERQRSITKRIVIALGVGLVILFPTSFEEKVSYAAHFNGFVFGLILALICFPLFKKKIRKAEVWKETTDEELTL